MERLQKVIAASGVCSRREAEKRISEGRVTVDGALVTQLGSSVDPTHAIILLDGKPLPAPAKVVYLLNKPRGVVCSRVAQSKEHIVTELVPDNPTVYSVGRLDKESEGALLLTNDGALTHSLTHPSFSQEKTYLVTVESAAPIEAATLCLRLEKGVKLGDGKAFADRAQITLFNPTSGRLTLTVHEGRHHLIRRMCATVDLKVRRLIRIRIHTLSLGNLKPGEYRRLTSQEIKKLHAS